MPVYKDKQRNTWYYAGAYIDVFGKSQSYKKRGFATKKEATATERLFLIDAKKTGGSNTTYEELFLRFIEYKKTRIKERSIYDYHQVGKKHLLPVFGKMKVTKITIPVIEKWQEELMKKGLKNQTTAGIQGLFASTMRFGVRMQLLPNNPMDYLDFVKDTNEANTKMQFWTLEQYQKFRSIITAFDDQLMFDVLYWTGMRFSEFQARTWEDLDFSEETLHIHTNYNTKNKLITKSTKNGEDRIIDLSEQLTLSLKEWKTECKKIDGFNSSCYIFGVFKPFPQKTLTNRKDAYILKHNEMYPDDPIPRIRIHDLRHSHVSYLANKGADSWDIAERLGHSKEMVEKRYSHMFPEKRRKMKKFLNG